MATYYVDDGGNNTDGSSWANAYTSLKSLDTAVTVAAGDIIYIGHDSVESTGVHSANFDFVSADVLPVAKIISATQGSSPAAYQKSATNQIDTSAGAYRLLINGAAALYGLKIKLGSQFTSFCDANESIYVEDCDIFLGANSNISISADSQSKVVFNRCLFDCTADGTTNRATEVIGLGGTAVYCEFVDCTFENVAYRTDVIIDSPGTGYRYCFISGCNFSGFTNGTECEIVGGVGGSIVVTNCITKSTFIPFTSAQANIWGEATLTNIGPADSPTYLAHKTYFGTTVSTSVIYRTGGAEIDATGVAWLVITEASAYEETPYKTPWIYGTTTAGSKTFDLYITNDDADFYDDEVWLEVEYLSTADQAIWALASDQRATITTTAAAQTDDTTSTWSVAGPSYTYKQKLSVTATVGEAGQYRARVCVGVASIASSRYFYIDPKVTVS